MNSFGTTILRVCVCVFLCVYVCVFVCVCVCVCVCVYFLGPYISS